MTARLVARDGPFAGRELRFDGEVTVGREPSNSLVLADTRISTRHARLTRDPADGGFWIEDLASRNGTYVDGLRVASRERLGALSVVRFGPEGDFLFQHAAPAGREAKTAVEPAPLLPAGLGQVGGVATAVGVVAPLLPAGLGVARTAPPAPKLRRVVRLTLEDGSSRTLGLRDGDNVVGRDPACGLALDEPTLSRRHAAIEVRGDAVHLRDLGSTNGSRLGDEKLLPQVVTLWPQGAVAFIGGLRAEWWEEIER